MSFIRITGLKISALTAFLAFSGIQSVVANPRLVVDARSGQVISAEEATRPWHPASTTKLMTVYIALKMLKAGEVKLDSPLQGTKRAAAQKPSKIGIRPGQIITLDNALKILLVKSANDIAYVIAENLSGSSEAFVSRMNNEAQQLGMRETYFTNPNGWHDSRQQTSARDLALLARALLYEFPDYSDYWGIGSVRLGSKIYKNTNGLIGRYDGATGMKTGFVCASGFNVVALAQRGGRTLITVVLGSTTSSGRTLQAAQLFDQGFQGGSTGQSLRDLPSSGQQTATNIRGQVCNGRKGIPLTDEDYDGAITTSGSQDAGGDKDSIYATFRGDQGVGQRRSSSRYALGERHLGEAVAVYLGRAPGNNDPIFRRGGSMIAVESAPPRKQYKMTPAPVKLEPLAPRLRPVPQVAESEAADADEAASPLSLTGIAAAAIDRPSSKAGIRTNPSSTQPRKLGAISSAKAVQPANVPAKANIIPSSASKTNGLVRPAPVASKNEAKKQTTTKLLSQEKIGQKEKAGVNFNTKRSAISAPVKAVVDDE